MLLREEDRNTTVIVFPRFLLIQLIRKVASHQFSEVASFRKAMLSHGTVLGNL